MRRAVPLVLLAVLSGCSLDAFRSKPLESQAQTSTNTNIGPPEQVRFNSGLGVDLAQMTKTPTGLYWKDLVVGTGAQAVVGSTVAVDYTGWLPDARQFDSSKNSGNPYTFVLGQGMVIAGWDQGVAGMRVGGRRLLVIPPELGYGASGTGGVIPPNATLVFDVELRDVPGQRAPCADADEVSGAAGVRPGHHPVPPAARGHPGAAGGAPRLPAGAGSRGAAARLGPVRAEERRGPAAPGAGWRHPGDPRHGAGRRSIHAARAGPVRAPPLEAGDRAGAAGPPLTERGKAPYV